MPHPLSSLGIAHTVISLLPVVVGLVSFARHRRIAPESGIGQLYLGGLALSVVTSFGLSSTGGINPGHILGVLALLAAFGGAFIAPRLAFFGRLVPHLVNFGLSFSFFLLMVPGINETLSRLPVAHPLATGPQDPLVKTALGVWLLVFLAGFTAQVLVTRRAGRAGSRIG